MIFKKDERKKVCFACFTHNNIFLSYLFSKTVYKNYKKILILSDWNCKESYNNIVEKCKLWDEVVLIHEAGKKERQKRFEEIKQQLQSIDFQGIDVLHYFQLNQHSYLNIIFQYLNVKTKLVVPAFNVPTHYLQEYFSYLKGFYKQRNIDIHIDYNRVSEIWTYNKRLYVGNEGDAVVKDINLVGFLKNKPLLQEFCEELNSIFNYTHRDLFYDVLFLEQPLRRFFIKENEEEDLLHKIINIFEGLDILVKLHPSVRTKMDKYNSLDIKVIQQNTVPWEVIFLNELLIRNLNYKVFVSYYSETIYTTHAFLNELHIPHKMFKLQGILEKYKSKETDIGDPMTSRFTEIYKQIYRNNFYDLTTFEELRLAVDELSFQKEAENCEK